MRLSLTMRKPPSPLSPDDLRVEDAAAVEQLTGLVPDYESYFERTGGIEQWGPVLDAAGWSGPLLRFKLRVLGRGGRDRVVSWARARHSPGVRGCEGKRGESRDPSLGASAAP